MTDRYDLLDIGAGAAGGLSACTAVARGARVAQIERDKIGGTCLNYGCDPTKTLLHSAQELSGALSYHWRRCDRHRICPTVPAFWGKGDGPGKERPDSREKEG